MSKRSSPAVIGGFVVSAAFVLLLAIVDRYHHR